MGAALGVVALVTVTIDIGRLRQVATLSAPGAVSPDGDGGYLQTYASLSPSQWRCSIESVSVSAERHFSATVLARASHLMRGRFHEGITTATRVSWVDRAGTTHTANVVGVKDSEGAGVETIAVVSEVQS